MKEKTLLLAAALAAVALAGCTDDAGENLEAVQPVDIEDIHLQSGKGAIQGLLIDDRFRPVADGLVLLQPLGLTAQSNENGEFLFLDVVPGPYTLKITADGHEASPQTVNVEEGTFAEANVVARRVINEAGSILTQEYSVFIPCAVDFVANGFVYDCTGDQSGDSFRAGFDANYTGIADVTVLITEMKANKDGRYEVQVRGDGNGERYAVAQFQGDYVKIVNRLGIPNQLYDGQSNNVGWNNSLTIETILFPDSEYREELQEAGSPTCCGAGVHTGIRATFVQSLFIGEPEVDLESYCTLC